MSGIYIIKCIPTEKIYIGKTIQPFNERWNSHTSQLFVIIGAKIKDDPLGTRDYWKLIKGRDLEYFSEEGVIGRVISRFDLDRWGSRVMSYSSLEGAFRVVEDAMRELGISEEVYLIADMFST